MFDLDQIRTGVINHDIQQSDILVELFPLLSPFRLIRKTQLIKVGAQV